MFDHIGADGDGAMAIVITALSQLRAIAAAAAERTRNPVGFRNWLASRGPRAIVSHNFSARTFVTVLGDAAKSSLKFG